MQTQGKYQSNESFYAVFMQFNSLEHCVCGLYHIVKIELHADDDEETFVLGYQERKSSLIQWVR